MKKACVGFELETPRDAKRHMSLEIVKDYGDRAYGHFLHTWDDGKRELARCRNCGGHVLIQSSEFHSFSDFSDDGYYTDYFPVEGPDEAEEINRNYNGFDLEFKFPSRYICSTNGCLNWSK